MKVLEILTAEEAGFCFGVKRAIDFAINAAKDGKNEPVYTLGPLIHNPQVVAQLEELGIKSIDSIDEIKEGTIIIRSHGVSPEVIDQARAKGLKIIDATCPYVKNAHTYAKKLINEGYQTIIYGDSDHPEVIGIHGATGKKAHIVNDLSDLNLLELSDRIGFVAQTTKSPSSFRNLISSVLLQVKELKVYNTICNTTEIRQQSAAKLAQKVDIMFVIGGHNSANTNRLAEICSQIGTPTYHIETVSEIDWQSIKGKKKIGITAGASTPDWLIKEVIEAMSEEKKDLQVEEKEEVKEEVQKVDNELNAAESAEKENEENVEKDESTVEENVEEPTSEETEEEFKYSDNDIADLKKGQTVTGTVVEVNDEGVYVDVGYKTEGFIPLRELSHRNVEDPREIVSVDDEIDVVILTLEDEEGNMILSKKRADYEKAWERIMKAYEENEIIEAEVTKEVKGGLVVDVGLRGFIPASHVAIGYVDDLSEYIGKTLRLKVIEVERDKNNVVLSAKKVLEEEREAEKEKTLASLEEGQVVKGKVTKLVDFGAFVDLGGVEGLLHISEIAWGRIDHPSEVLEEGQEIEVKILGINREEERISLGYKQLLPDPWEEFAKKHYEGEIVSGTITKIVDFGAFMEIEKGIEGLIHISQLSHRHVKTPDEVVTVGEEVKAKIINIDEEQKRVGLSIKELEEKPAPKPDVETKQKEKPVEKEENGTGVTIGDLVGDLFEDNE